jgi:hypothetical protein
MAERENYYLILDLDPTVSDQASIDARIREKQLEWSNAASTGVGAKARKANLYKGMLAAIRRVMSDPALRAAEAAAARKLRKGEQAAADADLDRHIAAICANGHFTVEQLKRLQNQFRASHDPAEVEGRLAKGCPRKDPTRRPGPRQLNTIDRTDLAKHDQNLGLIGKRDLYEFLGAGHKTPAATLYAEADRRNREIITRNQNTPEATAAKELCGLAMKLFAADDGKQRYDNSLSLAVMEAMRSVIQASVSNGRLGRAALDRHVREAAKQGMDRTRAQEFIVAMAAEQGWMVDDEAPLPVADLPQCSICGAIAERAEQSHCGACGHPFHIPCGRCGEPVPVANAACPHCGASLADAALVLDLHRRAEAALSAGDWSAAATLLARLQATWPDWGPAVELKQRLDARRDSHEQALATVRALLTEHRPYSARAALGQARHRLGDALGRGADGDLDRQLADAIDRAEQAFGAGERAARVGDADNAFDRYAEAVAIAADHPGAARALATMPPPAPTSLRVASVADGFALGWPEVQARGGVRYCVVGSAEHPPRDVGDGTLIAETAETGLTDTEAPVGRTWYYAVFSRRAGVASTTAARSGPHLRTAEVAALRAEPGAGSVTLNWQPPPNALGIVARRQVGSIPRGNRDGIAQTCGERSLHDTGLEDGRSYGYRISVQFADPGHPKGRITTAGIGITACPQRPPAAIDDLVQQRDEHGLTLTWTTPAGAQVQLRRGPYPSAFEPGRIIALDQADRLGEALPIHRPGQARVNIAGSGTFQVTPLSVRGQLAVVGQGARITNVDDVTAPRCRVAGHSIVLTWGWPPGVDTVRICYRTDRPPLAPDEPGAMAVDLPRAHYDRQDGWPLRVDNAKPHYFRLFAKAPDGAAYSGGVGTEALFGQGPRVQTVVRIRRNWLRRIRAIQFVLRSDNVAELHDIVVIVGRGQLPLDRNAGELAGHWRHISMVDGAAELTIPPEHWGPDRYARAFFLDGGRGVQLRPGGKEQMRLG